jgi:hypothetical protein
MPEGKASVYARVSPSKRRCQQAKQKPIEYTRSKDLPGYSGRFSKLKVET